MPPGAIGTIVQPPLPVAGNARAGETRAHLRYPLFVRRDLDAFFGLAINNLVDLIIIATVGPHAAAAARRADLRPHPAGGRALAARRQPLLRVAGAAAREGRRSRRRHRAALRAQHADRVPVPLPRDVPGLPADPGSRARLEGGRRRVLPLGGDRGGRGIRGEHAAADHATLGAARDARGRGARVHRAPADARPLRAAGRGPGAARDHPARLLRPRAPAAEPPRRTRGRRGGQRARLGHGADERGRRSHPRPRASACTCRTRRSARCSRVFPTCCRSCRQWPRSR